MYTRRCRRRAVQCRVPYRSRQCRQCRPSRKSTRRLKAGSSAHETTSLLKQHAEETRQALGRRAKKAKQKASATASAALQALEQASSIAEEPTVTLPPPFEQHGGGSSSSSAPAAAGRPPSPPQQHEAGGKSLSEVTEQLDRIEAAVLSLADAFGGLQRQVDALKQQQPIAAAPVVAEEKGGAVGGRTV